MSAAAGSGPHGLRSATPADVPALVELVNAAYAVEKFFKVGERTDEPEVHALMERGTFLVAESEAELVGAVYLEIAVPRGYFGLLSVAPRQQGRGLGAALMDRAEETCRSAGCTVMDIVIVNLRPELATLYGRRGYRPNGTRPFPSAGIPLRCDPRDVHFVCLAKDLVAVPAVT